MIPGLSESLISRYATPRSYQRGASYYAAGAVSPMVTRPGEVRAAVEGSRYEPYDVRITFDAGGITDVRCGCSYEDAGWESVGGGRNYRLQ
jgi:uncharacterized Zn finger protein